VPTQKQRREAAQRHLQRQLKARQAREARRKQVTLIASIVGTLVLIAAIVIVVVATTGSDDKKKTSAGGTTPSTTPNPCVGGQGTAFTGNPTKGGTVTFDAVTVKGAADIAHEPIVTAKGTKAPTSLSVKDLVVGKGKAADPTATVSVQYQGVFYCGTGWFDSSWEKGGKPISFSLTGVVPGFTQGIGGGNGIAPMKVGGRRIIIVPSALGYGASGQGSIPPNAPLVFVVDLTKVTPAAK
jgi:peptidylprolyl isomerase